MKIYFCLLLALSLIGMSCEKDDDLYSQGGEGATPVNEILRIAKISANAIPADTQTTSTISIQITQDAGSASRTLNLSTSLGVFANGKDTETLTVNAYGRGQFQIRSAKIGNATISLTTADIKIDTLVNFFPALPDDMLINLDKYIIDATQSAVITVSLSRDPGNGIVSDPIKVYFSVTGTGSEQLQLPAFANSVNGVANATLSNPFGIKGTFKVSINTINRNGSPIVKTKSIQIN